MKKKWFSARKYLLYALLGSSLLWQTAFIAYAEAAAKSSETTVQSDEISAAQDEFSLKEIEVTADRETSSTAYSGGQVDREANLGVLGDKDFMDTPFNATSYTTETMEDQQADTLYDVLINDPSVRFTTSSGHNNENYMIRGLDVNYQHLYFNGMSGLAPHHQVPVEFLERVDVLKGAGSLLYGGVTSSVGGAINLVPKRAGEEDITNFTTSYASESLWGGHLDIGRRFGKNKEWGVRFNGVYADGDTATDDQSKERMLGALGLDYRSDRWRLSLDAFSSEVTNDNGAVSMYSLAKYGYVKAPDGSTNAYRGTSSKMKNVGVLFKGEYDLQDNLTAYAGIGTLSTDATGFINGNHVLDLQSDGSATLRNVFKQYFWTETTSSELGLRGTYQTGTVKHQVVLGASFIDTDYSNAFDQGTGNYPTNIYNPISIADEYDTVVQPKKGNKTSVTEVSSVVLSDTLSFSEDKVQLTLGVRQQTVDQTGYKYSGGNLATGVPTVISTNDSNATTPLAGLVVKPWGEGVSLYANYIEALSPGTMVGTAYANANEILDPYKSKQHEIGVKWDKGNFANTLAFFQIEMPSYMTSDDKVLSYDGEQRNRGLEWNAFGNVAKNLRLLGGVAYIDGELVRSSISGNNGNTPLGVPEWTANLGVEWDTPWVRDLTLSLRGIYTGSQYINNANTIEIPSWVRYDIGMRYKTMINKVPITYRLSVENLFDEHYWAGCFGQDNYVTLGSPRTMKLAATMHF